MFFIFFSMNTEEGNNSSTPEVFLRIPKEKLFKKCIYRKDNIDIHSGTLKIATQEESIGLKWNLIYVLIKNERFTWYENQDN